ncbi:Ser/Thr protein kinase RdoA (MazF antagonist) [Hydrogenophaga palleronii]|uniref:Ser/Thr protein kinase RdoA (MazF antagonist) n=1 Tax=Hydrogenophaga palleronii TaxID=65655 RepID=A0ABU1WKF1_9BURK|nr:phosphotransferase [Hydrogenophaga palleronii]MDR7149764.1 Ser/Thr protein kinase RdoA (MazF antagonist) [Hydrogenophaga palleronii]
MEDAAWLALAREAASRWPLSVERIELAARRENKVFRLITVTGQHFALRVHRAGYRSDAELASELAWMQALSRGGLAVPAPLASLEGRMLEAVKGQRVSMLSWLAGVPLGRSGTPLNIASREGVFRALGQTLARLHNLSDAWSPPPGFTRPQWGLDGLLGPQPLWGSFWAHPRLEAVQRRTLERARAAAIDALGGWMPALDFGLIHADAVRENVLIDQGRIQLIDFDDCAYGFRLFDLATALLRNRAEPDYPALEAALCEGYRSLRVIDTGQLQLFLMLRALTYIGWIVPRMDEEGGVERSARFVATGIELAEAWLGSR